MAYRASSLVVALALTSCGRTSLLDTGVEPPAVVHAPADGGPSCRLVVTGAPLALPYDHTPRLVPWTEDGSRVGLVHGNGNSTAVVSGILARSFVPWGQWPPKLLPEITACASCMVDTDRFSVSPARPAAQQGFSMVAVNVTLSEDAPPSYQATFRAAVPAGDAPVVLSEAADVLGPFSLARGAAGHILAYTSLPGGDQAPLRLAYVPAGSSVPEPLGDVGYGLGPVSLIPFQSGFLAAVWSRLDSGGASGDPSLSVMRVDESTKQIAVTATLPDTQDFDDVALVELARGSEGAWLVYQSTLIGPDPLGPIRAVRLTKSGALAGPVVEVSEGGEYITGAAVMGSRLVLSGPRDLVTSPNTLRLIVIEEDGQVQRVTVDVSPTSVSIVTFLLASPDESQLLVGYAGHVARLGCAPGG